MLSLNIQDKPALINISDTFITIKICMCTCFHVKCHCTKCYYLSSELWRDIWWVSGVCWNTCFCRKTKKHKDYEVEVLSAPVWLINRCPATPSGSLCHYFPDPGRICESALRVSQTMLQHHCCQKMTRPDAPATKRKQSRKPRFSALDTDLD